MANVEFPTLDSGRTNGAMNGNGSSQPAKITLDTSVASLTNAAKDSLRINDKVAVLALDTNKPAAMKKPLEQSEAKETLAETKEMIQRDLSATMLAQANATPQSFLSLFS